jgi:hypothetical protein
MSIMESHKETSVNNEVEPVVEESEEASIPTEPDSDIVNSHSAATVRLDSFPFPESASPTSHSAPTVTLRPPQPD